MNANLKARIIMLLAGSILAVAVAAGADDGRVIAAIGEVTAQRDDLTLALKKDTPVRIGDLIRTGERAATQLLMNDNTILSLRQKSEMEIAAYEFDEEQRAGAARFSLVRGAMRTLTGKIGVHAPENFQVTTVAATIGIRGTHFSLRFCADDCAEEGEETPRNGLYGGVTEGRIAVINATGETLFSPGEYFYVADFNSRPERLSGSPPLLNDRLAWLAEARRSGEIVVAASALEATPDAFLSPITPMATPDAFLSPITPMPTLASDLLNTLSVSQLRPIEENIAPENLVSISEDVFAPIGSAGTIRGQIIWMTDADIDLHMLAPDEQHVYYGASEITLSSGATAQLDHDNLGGVIDLAPDQRIENIVVNGTAIPVGNYTFYVNSFSGNNDGLPTNVQVRVTGDNNHTSLSQTATLQDGENSDHYLVNYQGPSIAPTYSIQSSQPQ